MNDKYFIYILRSQKDDKFYVGQTSDLSGRMDAHNRGSVKSTKNRRPLDLVYFRTFDNSSEAIREEVKIKNYKDTFKFLSNLYKSMAPSSSG